MNSKQYLQEQFKKLNSTKYGFSIKIFDGSGNSTNQMELTPNRAIELLEILKQRQQEIGLTPYKGAGIYDDEDFSFIESCNNAPDNIEIGTCWIGDENTYNEIINNL